MTTSLSTDGFVGGGGGGGGSGPDASPPTITAISPSVNTAPGAVGGFPANYAAAAATPIVLRVEDTDGRADLLIVHVTARFLDGRAETAYRLGSFAAGYVAGSSQVTLTTGFLLTIARAAGWPAAVVAGSPAVMLVVDAVDLSGNLTTALLTYRMPTIASGPPVIPATTTPGAADLIAEASSLVVWQLR